MDKQEAYTAYQAARVELDQAEHALYLYAGPDYGAMVAAKAAATEAAIEALGVYLDTIRADLAATQTA